MKVPAAKKTPKVVLAEEVPTKATTPKVVSTEKYIYAVGRRKTAVAQVRFYADAKVEGIEVIVNNLSHIQYFKTFEQREAAIAPLKTLGKMTAKFSVHVMGGGHSGQADAVKLGIARTLVAHDPLVRPLLKADKLLTRDPRAVERKKPGLKKARRAPQWAKR